MEDGGTSPIERDELAALVAFDQKLLQHPPANTVAVILGVGVVVGLILGGAAEVWQADQIRTAFVEGAASGLRPTPPLPAVADEAVEGVFGPFFALGLIFVLGMGVCLRGIEAKEAAEREPSGRTLASRKRRAVSSGLAKRMTMVHITIVGCIGTTAAVGLTNVWALRRIPDHPVYQSSCNRNAPVVLEPPLNEATVELRAGCWSEWIDVRDGGRWSFNTDGAMNPAVFFSDGRFFPEVPRGRRTFPGNPTGFRLMGSGTAWITVTYEP